MRELPATATSHRCRHQQRHQSTPTALAQLTDDLYAAHGCTGYGARGAEQSAPRPATNQGLPKTWDSATVCGQPGATGVQLIADAHGSQQPNGDLLRVERCDSPERRPAGDAGREDVTFRTDGPQFTLATDNLLFEADPRATWSSAVREPTTRKQVSVRRGSGSEWRSGLRRQQRYHGLLRSAESRTQWEQLHDDRERS